jgi:septal ring factor EnvC (AmiA/AmiB activator)
MSERVKKNVESFSVLIALCVAIASPFVTQSLHAERISVLQKEIDKAEERVNNIEDKLQTIAEDTAAIKAILQRMDNSK